MVKEVVKYAGYGPRNVDAKFYRNVADGMQKLEAGILIRTFARGAV